MMGFSMLSQVWFCFWHKQLGVGRFILSFSYRHDLLNFYLNLFFKFKESISQLKRDGANPAHSSRVDLGICFACPTPHSNSSSLPQLSQSVD